MRTGKEGKPKGRRRKAKLRYVGRLEGRKVGGIRG